jgi:hypothetical protein
LLGSSLSRNAKFMDFRPFTVLFESVAGAFDGEMEASLSRPELKQAGVLNLILIAGIMPA